jgi:hypothetical protein
MAAVQPEPWRRALITTTTINNNNNNNRKNLNNNQDLTLNIYHQNICGLQSKINELVLSLSQEFPQIFCIPEHHLKKSQICITVMEN